MALGRSQTALTRARSLRTQAKRVGRRGPHDIILRVIRIEALIAFIFLLPRF